MVFDLVIPEVNAKFSTKDVIISVLSREWPLTPKVIFNRVKKEYKIFCTYQAIFKSVKELLEKEVLIENGGAYQISIGWVKKLQGFTDIIETNYYAKERIESLAGLKEADSSGSITVLTFESIFDAEKYLYYFMKSELQKTKKDKVFWQLGNEWRPIFYLRSEYNYYRRLSKFGHKFYFLCSGNSNIEKRNKKFYNEIGVNFKFVKDKFSNDTLVFGDYLINIFIPNELKNKLGIFLKKDDIMLILKEVLDFKSNIKVVINKDQNLAGESKKHLLSRFS